MPLFLIILFEIQIITSKAIVSAKEQPDSIYILPSEVATTTTSYPEEHQYLDKKSKSLSQ
jgi:hypothetical protein